MKHFLIKNGRKCEEKHFTPLDINAAKAADGSKCEEEHFTPLDINAAKAADGRKNDEVINSYNSLL